MLIVVEAFFDVGAPVVFFDPRIHRGHIEGHDLCAGYIGHLFRKQAS